MKAEELAAIKERAEKATTGPWVSDRRWFVVNEEADIFIAEAWENVANADFIANARQDVPNLVTEVERYQKYIETLKHVYWSGTDYELEQMIIRGVEDE